MKRRAFVALAGLGALAEVGGLGCSGSRAAGSRARCVSLAPSTTEAVFAIGAGARLVGRSRYCDWPPEVAGLPAVGGFADPSVEAIVALAPGLVVGAHGPAGPALEEGLRARGVATYFPETESLAQIDAMVIGLGEHLGAADAARARVEAMRAARAATAARVERALSGRARPRAVFLFDASPVVVAGPGSFTDEILRAAGAANAVARGGAYPTVGHEELAALDPDVLVDGSGHAGRSALGALRDAPGFKDLRAVKAGRVLALATSTALRPGPRIDEGVRELAKLVLGDPP